MSSFPPARLSPIPAAPLHSLAAAVPPRRRLAVAGGAVSSLVLAILFWGANWPVMKLGLGHVTPLWFSALRFGTGAACLFAVQAMRGGVRLPRRRDLPFVASVGLLQMLCFTVLGALAMTLLPAGRSALLSYTTPLWVLPASVLFFGERVPGPRLAGIGLAALGVAVLMNPLSIDWADPRVLGANLMLLTASLCWSACILHLRYGRPASAAFALAPWQMLLATLLLVPLALTVEGPFTGDGSAAFLASTLYVGPVATAFCFCAVNAASARLPATGMATAMLGVPVTGVALSMLLLGERLTPTLLLGSLAILGGIAAAALPTRFRS
ncbi:DMT family transporter [Roseomonas sp. NAR14]|uniref:DMT family transporter n=1 Tax=Roseomonas acroporae TaxID=2937791 RepID=A0A9X1YDD5_9PROT|nr:DMT family transporter [Roseomonas acroporae]MCK8787732.1 DMT family transporter [Roseomonas acroporae]